MTDHLKSSPPDSVSGEGRLHEPHWRDEFRIAVEDFGKAVEDYMEDPEAYGVSLTRARARVFELNRLAQRRRFVQGFVEGAEWCRGRKMFNIRDIRTPAGAYAEERFNTLSESPDV